MASSRWTWIAWGFLAVTLGLPLLNLFLLGVGGDIGHPYYARQIGRGFLQAVASTLLACSLAFLTSWVLHARRMPQERIGYALIALPFLLPVIAVVAATEGIRPDDPFWAVVVTHAYYEFGFAVYLFTEILRRRNQNLEEQAKLLGATPWQAFRLGSLPTLQGSLLGVVLLVFFFTFGSFGVILLLGQGQLGSLETLLYRETLGIFPDFPTASTLALLQLAINVVVLGAYAWLSRTRQARGTMLRIAAPTRATKALYLAVLGVSILPLGQSLIRSLRIRGDWSLEPWRALLEAGHPNHVGGFDLGHALGNTLLYAGASVAIAIGLSLLLLERRTTWRQAPILLPLATSSVLIGIGHLITFDDPIDLRGTRTLIVLAHTLILLPLIHRFLLGAFQSIPQGHLDQIQLMGATSLQSWRYLILPTLRPTLSRVAGLGAAMSIGDFGASLLLMRTDQASLSVWAYRHDLAFRTIEPASGHALTFLTLLLSLLVLALGWRKTHA